MYPKGRAKTLDKKSGRNKNITPWNKGKKYKVVKGSRQQKQNKTE